MLTLGSLFSLGLRLRACGGTGLPSRGLGVPPCIRVRVASVLVRVLVVLVWLAVSASSSSTLTFVLPLSTSFGLALAGVVAFAFASTFARAFARILTLQLRRQALLVVALILVVLPLPTEGTGDSTPVVIRQLRLGAVLVSCCFPWTMKQSRCSQSGACCRWPCSSLASHQKSSLTFFMIRACLGVVPCPIWILGTLCHGFQSLHLQDGSCSGAGRFLSPAPAPGVVHIDPRSGGL